MIETALENLLQQIIHSEDQSKGRLIQRYADLVRAHNDDWASWKLELIAALPESWHPVIHHAFIESGCL